MGEVGDHVEYAAELDALAELLLWGRFLLNCGAVRLLTRLDAGGIDALDRRGLCTVIAVLVGMRVAVSMAVVVSAVAPGRDTKPLVHCDESHEADQDGDPEQEVPVGFHEDEASFLEVILAQEYLGEQVEERITHQAADCECHHDGQRRGVDIRRTKRQEEVGRAGYVEGGQQGIDSGRAAGEEDGEELGDLGGLAGEAGELLGSEGVDDGALL